MYHYTIQPRFAETDALGHISNTVLPVWFEEARIPIFKRLHPSLKVADWPLILAHIDVDFVNQIYVGSAITVKVRVSKIGGKSFTVYHEAWQNDTLVATGNAVHVRFDFSSNTTVDLGDEFRAILAEAEFAGDGE